MKGLFDGTYFIARNFDCIETFNKKFENSMKEVENNIITLADMKPGDQAEIIGYQGGDQRYKSKLLAMGLVRGVVLELLQIAPLGDPLK